MLTCDTVSASSLTARDVALWRGMQAVTPAFASPLLSPDFVQAIAAVRSDVRIAVFKKNGRTVGFLPIHVRPGRFARPVGAPFSDYSALITFPEPHIRIGDALRTAGIQRYQAIGLIDPYGVFGDCPGGETDEAHGIDLSSGMANNANKKLQKNIRRITRHLEEAHGEVRIVAGDRTRTTFDAMIDWKRRQTRETGLHDFVAAPWVQKMLGRLFEADTDGLHGFMVTLMAGDTPVLAHYGIRLGDRAHPWISSYDPAFSTFSPGQIFLNGLQEPLEAAGVRYYDLSTGQQAYKAIFSNTSFAVRHTRAYSDAPDARISASMARVGADIRRVLGPKVDGAFARLNRRLDQIATLELDTLSRARGVAYAFSNASKRMKVADHG